MNAAQENFSNLLGGLATGDESSSGRIDGNSRFYRCEFTAAWAFIATPIGAFIVGLMGIGLATREWAKYIIKLLKQTFLSTELLRLLDLILIM
jgi:hypothetical protein